MDELELEAALTVLRTGELEVTGRLVDASNATLCCSASLDGVEVMCVYKPRAGERPLWDFPDGTLARREVASYEVSSASGWGIVPPTVMRDGPFGVGMCQLWVDVDPSVELVDVLEPAAVPDGWLGVLDALGPRGRPVVLAHADDDRLRRMAVLDVVLNNADRKGGHVLPDVRGGLRGVDHGVTFHTEPKLRTVLWGWAGSALTDDELAVLDRLRAALGEGLGTTLGGLLSRGELRATRARVDRLLADRAMPLPGEGWPSIPWPPF